MARYIEIKNCKDCPHIAHRVTLNDGAYIPVCSLENTELPYKPLRYSSFMRAATLPGIPD